MKGARQREQETYRRNPAVRCRFLPEWGAAICYSPGIRGMVGMSTTTYLIWRLCDGQHTIADIQDIMADNFFDPSHSRNAVRGEVIPILAALSRTLLVLSGDVEDKTR